jgi:hypothetical protein
LAPDGALRGVELPFAIDDAAYSVPLDLVQHPVLVVAKDTDFAGDLVEALSAWRADARWIGAGETALRAAVNAASDSRRPVLIVDGRTELLSALSGCIARLHGSRTGRRMSCSRRAKCGPTPWQSLPRTNWPPFCPLP